MTTPTDGALTTGAEFTEAFAKAAAEGEVDAMTSEEDLEESEEIQAGDEQDGDDAEASTIATGEEAETDDESVELTSYVSDVAALIKEGKSEEALARLGDYGKGVEKLDSQRVEAREQVDSIRALFDGIGKKDPEAFTALADLLDAKKAPIDTIIDELLTAKGTSVESILAARYGVELSELEEALSDLNGEEVKLQKPERKAPAQKESQPSPEIAKMQAHLDALENEKQEKAWVDKYGVSIAKFVESKTGLKFDPTLLAKVRHELPKNAKPEDIEEAVMKLDPKAYKAAQAARKAPTTAPNAATISKGGKSAAKADAMALLNNPTAFESLIKG